MAINWELGVMPDIVGNALAAFDEGQTRRAYSSLAENPNDPKARAVLYRNDPKAALLWESKRAETQEKQQEQQANMAKQTAAILRQVKADPSKYPLARQAAIRLGIPAASIPEQYDPQWVDQQDMIYSAFEKDGGQSLTTLAQNVMMTLPPEQRDPNNPAFIAAFNKAFIAEQTKTIPYTQGGGVAGYNPYTGQTNTIIAPNPGDKPTGAPVGGGSMPRVSTPQEAAKLPPGTRFIMPDGRIGTVPGGASGNAGGNFRPVANATQVARSLFPALAITQGRRDPNSALGRANPNSWHNKSGGAIDVKPVPGMTFDQYVQTYRNAGYNIIEARDEVKNPSRHATGPHWHIVLGERN